jgi:hypothetical protein
MRLRLRGVIERAETLHGAESPREDFSQIFRGTAIERYRGKKVNNPQVLSQDYHSIGMRQKKLIEFTFPAHFSCFS